MSIRRLSRVFNETERNTRGIMLTLAICLTAVVAAAAQPETLTGEVVDPQRQVVPGASVTIRSLDGAIVDQAVTGATGEFRLTLAPGAYELTVELSGFASERRAVSLDPGAAFEPLSIQLRIAGFDQEVIVSANMPDIAREIRLPGRELDERTEQDVGEYLRTQPGLSSVRRGPINLEPTIRGLQENQVGMFVDGTRTFSAGPARMDSDLSHVSPRTIESVRVVKGPYALTWGAGTLSAVQVETFRPAFTSEPFTINGRVGLNYGGNGDRTEGSAGFWGASERARFSFFQSVRTGNNYKDGDDNLIPGDYESFDTRWSAGGRVGDRGLIEYSGGYQKQNDIDYPGRILDATLFETFSHSVEATWSPAGGRVRELFAQFYVNTKDHVMNNDEKPTALNNPNRVPPFGLRVDLPATSDTIGGSAHAVLGQGPIDWKLGVDFFSLDQSADRSVYRRRDDRLLFTDIVWPDANINDVGAYTQLIYRRGRGQVGAAVRIDAVSTSAGETSPFFDENTTGDLDQTETNVSAALNATMQVNDLWSVSAGVGRAVRTAMTLERYSDRFPTTKFQVAAEFMGNPSLKPERGVEVNVGTIAGNSRATVEADFFYRQIDDYITVMPDPSLLKRLPLSPNTVFRYINGTTANFTGYEVRGRVAASDYLDVQGFLGYVRATDVLLDEPVFGIPPFEQRFSVRGHSAGSEHWVELVVSHANEQDRVATARLEVPTVGWTTIDLLAGIRLGEGAALRIGLENLADQAYTIHLNALNPFARSRIFEPGRRAYLGLEYEF
ncbi:MAG: TonB-dependent receptor [Vicinamibacterales bacterium]|nr:TonB-dependent receptor [Vicinamibacterales bacterium]